MEALEFLSCLLEFLDATSILTTFIAWMKSEPNRDARREARTVGATPPPRDFWFQVFVVMTPITITLTILVLIRWLAQ